MNTAVPDQNFAFPPYRALPARDDIPGGVWYVANCHGLNVLRFCDGVGRVFACRQEAEALADDWNREAGL